MDDLGSLGSAYRERVYAGFSGAPDRGHRASRSRSLLDAALSYIDASLRANRREDALYHSYNILDLSDGAARIRRLPEMLEGQVAMLSSGELGAQESLALLAGAAGQRPVPRGPAQLHAVPGQGPRRLPRSQHVPGQSGASPARWSPPWSRRGTAASWSPTCTGTCTSPPASATSAMCRRSSTGSRPIRSWARWPQASRAELLDIFEEVFTHAEFTGRSGSFFAYEGLGSIYWHMVSKLLLAVQETIERAVADGESSATVQALVAAYEDVRAGLGYCKPAEVYGAFPTDPYSHTPAGHGARQPGMTGQVKEEVLTRLGELGLRVEDGQIVFRPVQLRATEWREAPGTFEYVDVLGDDATVDLPAGSLAFTFCQVPVVYRQADALSVRVVRADGTAVECPDGADPRGAQRQHLRPHRGGRPDRGAHPCGALSPRAPDRAAASERPAWPAAHGASRRCSGEVDLREQLRGEPVGRHLGVERAEAPFDRVGQALPRGQGHVGALVLELDVVALRVEVHLDLALARCCLVECQVGEDPQEEGRVVRVGQPATGVGEELRRSPDRRAPTMLEWSSPASSPSNVAVESGCTNQQPGSSACFCSRSASWKGWPVAQTRIPVAGCPGHLPRGDVLRVRPDVRERELAWPGRARTGRTASRPGARSRGRARCAGSGAER